MEVLNAHKMWMNEKQEDREEGRLGVKSVKDQAQLHC